MLAKTEKGRDALKVRGILTRRERFILILCDAKRGVDDVVKMMDVDAGIDIARLIHRGFLVDVSANLQKVAEFSDTGTIDFALTKPHTKEEMDAFNLDDMRRAAIVRQQMQNF